MSQSYARYVGGATTRRITQRDWRSRGIDQGTLSWTAANGYSVPRDDISDAAWEILRLDPGLVLTEDEPTPQVMADAKVEAAKARLLARAGGAEVLHAQDPIQGVDESTPAPKTPDA
jgi:hypothetical protein